jgi:hypothetical protein
MIAPSEAVDLFAQTYMRGIFYRALALILRRPRRLRRLALAEVRGMRRYDGAYSVPLWEIGGSEGRDDFDAGFHPVREDMSKRWLGVARAALRGEHLPPVELIRVGDVYYVRDGHHRISVARALGQREIDARVTVWEQPRPKPQPECAPDACRRPGAGSIVGAGKWLRGKATA